jgi:PAS domain S-box-containing protein
MPFADLDNIPAIVLVANRDGEIVFANKAIEKILGFKTEDLLGNGWWELTTTEVDRKARREEIARLADGSLSVEDRNLFINPINTIDGRTIWTQWTNKRTADGYLIGIAQDVTAKVELEHELKKSNKEIEVLLQELHHRVKNNLQVISSYLNVQFEEFTDEKVQGALDKTRQRIDAMALLHNSQYTHYVSEDADFNAYLRELCHHFVINYEVSKTISLNTSFLGNIKNTELAMNIGLIITELLSNAYKHAFPDRTEGTIDVKMTADSNGLHELILSDNGRGVDIDTIEQGLGMEIVNSLVAQIGGTLEMVNRSGLRYTIKFKA